MLINVKLNGCDKYGKLQQQLFSTDRISASDDTIVFGISNCPSSVELVNEYDLFGSSEEFNIMVKRLMDKLMEDTEKPPLLVINSRARILNDQGLYDTGKILPLLVEASNSRHGRDKIIIK